MKFIYLYVLASMTHIMGAVLEKDFSMKIPAKRKFHDFVGFFFLFFFSSSRLRSCGQRETHRTINFCTLYEV